MNKAKRTSLGVTGSKKSIKVEENVSVDYKDKYFNWSIDTNYIYTADNCPVKFREEYCLLQSLEEFKRIIKRLNTFRTWTWRKIETSPNGTSCGMMSINKLDESKFISEYLNHIGKYGVDVLYKMEINNHHRVWGIREDDCLYLIWNDPDHSFYKHQNTNYTKSKTISLQS